MRRIFIAVLVLFVAGCGSGGGSSGSSSATADITGKWAGNFSSSSTGRIANVNVVIAQSGNYLTAHGISSEGCFTSFYIVAGGISGDQLTVFLAGNMGGADASGTATSTEIVGSYSVVSGGCSGDYGSISLYKETSNNSSDTSEYQKLWRSAYGSAEYVAFAGSYFGIEGLTNRCLIHSEVTYVLGSFPLWIVGVSVTHDGCYNGARAGQKFYLVLYRYRYGGNEKLAITYPANWFGPSTQYGQHYEYYES